MQTVCHSMSMYISVTLHICQHAPAANVFEKMHVKPGPHIAWFSQESTDKNSPFWDSNPLGGEREVGGCLGYYTPLSFSMENDRCPKGIYYSRLPFSGEPC